MHYKSVIAMLLVSFLVLRASTIRAQSQPINLNGGLQAQVGTVGRDKTFHALTVSMTLMNKGKNTIYLLLLTGHGYPNAVDNSGAAFAYETAGGVAVCPLLNATPQCIGVPDIIQGQTPPLQAWMELDPDSSPVSLNFQLYLATVQESHGSLASFSCIFAYRAVSDPVRDGGLTESQKRQQINLVNLSFPSTPVTQEQ
jgi:hypothetical protein